MRAIMELFTLFVPHNLSKSSASRREKAGESVPSVNMDLPNRARQAGYVKRLSVRFGTSRVSLLGPGCVKA